MFCCVLLFLWGELHLVKLNHEESLLIDSGFTVLTNSAFPDVWRMVLLSPAGFLSPGVSDFTRCGGSFLTLGLCYLLGWRKEGKRAMIWVELKLKRTLKGISDLSVPMFLKVKLKFLEGQPCWTAEMLFTPFDWLNKWLNGSEAYLWPYNLRKWLRMRT